MRIRNVVALSSTMMIATWTVAMASTPLTPQINDAEKTGSLSHEQATQLRHEDEKISDKEVKLKEKHGSLSAKDEDGLQKERLTLGKKMNKVMSMKEDNTGKNLGDGRTESPTPQVQSERKADVNLTADIRRKLMHDKGLSEEAKNVKVVSINGTVTLRGPVKSSDEKQRIFAAAQECAGGGKVLNELEVNPK